MRTSACYIAYMPYCGIHFDTYYLYASVMHDETAGCWEGRMLTTYVRRDVQV